MGGFDNYLEGKVLDEWFGGVVADPPATLYVALLSAVPTDTSCIELVAASYARVAVANTKDNWTTSGPSGSPVSNKVEIDYGQAGEDWGNIYGFAVFDALEGGNKLAHGEWNDVRDIKEGDSAVVGVGKITIRFIDD